MAKVNEILEELMKLAPEFMKESWDNVGLLCGRGMQDVDTVLVALDPFLPVCEEAAACGAQLIVTHHPILFSTRAITDADAAGKTLLFLAEHGMAAINLHTNLDAAPGGVNDCLAAALGLAETEVLAPAGVFEGKPYGIGRVGLVAQMPLEAFIQEVQMHLGCTGLRYADAGRPVRKVAVGGGSCSGLLKEAAAHGCDTFVTSDVKYNGFVDSVDLGINMIDAGHFYTENLVCSYVAEKLQTLFPQIRVLQSKRHTDVIKFYQRG